MDPLFKVSIKWDSLVLVTRDFKALSKKELNSSDTRFFLFKPEAHLELDQASRILRKTLHLRCLTGFWIRLCKQLGRLELKLSLAKKKSLSWKFLWIVNPFLPKSPFDPRLYFRNIKLLGIGHYGKKCPFQKKMLFS